MSRVRTQKTEIREFKLASYNTSLERWQVSLVASSGKSLASFTLSKHSIPGWTIETARAINRDYSRYFQRIFGEDAHDQVAQEKLFRELLCAWRAEQVKAWDLLSGQFNGSDVWLKNVSIRFIFPSGKSLKLKLKPERKRL